MRAKLESLLAKVQGGKDEVYLLKAATIREILTELRDIVMPAGGLEAGKTPVIVEENKGRAGFKLSVPTSSALGLGTVSSPYTMLGDALSPAALQTDTWDVEAPPGGTEGVIWKGPRLYFEATTTPDTTTDSNGDTTDWDLVTCVLASRQLTFDTSGNLRTISAEIEMGSFGFR